MDANKASSTAYTVMQGLLWASNQPQYAPLVDADIKQSIRTFLSASPEGQRRIQQVEGVISTRMLRIFEKLLAPNISVHYALRKKFFLSNVEKLIASGTRQVVNIGAGFDLLAWNLHKKYPDVKFVEIDHPSTSQEKVAIINTVSAPGDNLSFLAFDLSDEGLYAALSSQNTIEPNISTVFICEGVFMYLDDASVINTFNDIQKFDPKAAFLFTALAPFESPENNSTWLLRTYLRLKKEPIEWCIEPSGIKAFLEGVSFRCDAILDDEKAYLEYLSLPPETALHKGEFMVAATSNV